MPEEATVSALASMGRRPVFRSLVKRGTKPQLPLPTSNREPRHLRQHGAVLVGGHAATGRESFINPAPSPNQPAAEQVPFLPALNQRHRATERKGRRGIWARRP